MATTELGAVQLNKPAVSRWARPVFEAYCSGAWILYWTESTLYWVAKPTVHTEPTQERRRLHREDGPALDSDLEDLYFWHGVLVPSFVVIRPELIELAHINGEENSEVRRVMIERYGPGRYITESHAEKVHADDFGILWRVPQPNDDPLMVCQVVNSTPEPDGSFKDYWLMVHHELRPLLSDEGELGWPQELTARNAVASTFGLTGAEYVPEFQS